MTTAIIIPVLRRPHRVAPLVEDIRSATPEDHLIVFVATRGDTEQIDACVSIEGVATLFIDPQPWGDYAKKINMAYRSTFEPFLFLGADDLHFHQGWLTAAMSMMSDTIGVVGTQDLGQPRVLAGEHSTHSLVARWYVDRYGTIDEERKVLHERYPHEFVDDEFIQTAKMRGAFAFCDDSVVEHMHPHWGKSEMDDLYRDEPRRMAIGRKLFRQRRVLWERLR